MSDYSSNRLVIALMLGRISKESLGDYMTARKDAIAYATYTDKYAGNIGAELRAYKTRKNGLNITRYRWKLANGSDCGLLSFESAKQGIWGAMAAQHRFTAIHIMISARHLFE